jgi:hypothetical protein
MIGFFRTVLILLLVYFVFKILVRWFGPKLFRYAARKTEARFKEQFGQFTQQNQPKEDNIEEVIINKNPTKQHKASKKVGEYIDFEEIE